MRPDAIDAGAPMRLPVPTRVHAHIAPYIRGRRSTQLFTEELDRQTRADTGCRTSCPPDHTCYPTGGDGCVLGERRPGRDHCCQLDTDNTDRAFLATVTHMHQFASSDATNRGTASEEYRADLGRIIPTGLASPMHSVFHQPRRIDFYFRFESSHSISEARRYQIVRLGAKLFRVMNVRVFDDTELVSRLDKSIVRSPTVFIEAQFSQRTVHIRADFLTLARNIKLVTNELNLEQTDLVPDEQLILSEQDVFNMIEQKLREETTDPEICRVAMEVAYKGEGQASFLPIIDACQTSSFRGTIVCGIYPETQVRTGQFNGFSITIMSHASMARGDLNIPEPEPGFSVLDAHAALVIRK